MSSTPIGYLWVKNVIPKKEESSIAEEAEPKLRIIHDSKVTDLITILRNKKLGEEISEDELRMKRNVHRWISEISSWDMRSLDEITERDAEELLNEFHDNIKSRGREEGKYSAGLLKTKDYIVLFHSKRALSLAEVKTDVRTLDIRTVERILDPQNVHRAVVIRKKDQKCISLSTSITDGSAKPSSRCLGWMKQK